MPVFDLHRAARPMFSDWHLRRFLQGGLVRHVARGCPDLCAREGILLS